MIHKPIYEPKARAREYGDLAVNIYSGCPHGCYYCFAPGTARKTREAFSIVTLRRDIAKSVERQLEREQIRDKLIHLCFMCDPYPAGIDTTPTREVIQLIKASGNAVQLLTKGGARAERDFDLLDSGDWFGATITGAVNPLNEDWRKYEPGASSPHSRITTLLNAHMAGIKTWVSCEPVIDPEGIYSLIERESFIDLFRIGKLNHHPSGINWAEFGAKCVELCERHGRDYYLKDDLREEMAKGGTLDYSSCPYWRADGCAGLNCCLEKHCPYAKESQPWLFVNEGGGR